PPAPRPPTPKRVSKVSACDPFSVRCPAAIPLKPIDPDELLGDPYGPRTAKPQPRAKPKAKAKAKAKAPRRAPTTTTGSPYDTDVMSPYGP
ncbi:MAG: hypothetical protein WKG01_41850, partial [Kofleriaceae bacterium]